MQSLPGLYRVQGLRRMCWASFFIPICPLLRGLTGTYGAVLDTLGTKGRIMLGTHKGITDLASYNAGNIWSVDSAMLFLFVNG